MENNRVLESLMKLKSQERPKGYKEPVIFKSIPAKSEPVRTLQQHKVKDIIASIENMERKMKSDSSNYLNLYYDLIKLEKKFLEAVAEMEKGNVNTPELFEAEISRRRAKIEAKHSKIQNLSNESN